jgi:hypothetical protein
MRVILTLLIVVVLVAIVGIWTGLIDVTQTRHGALPTIAVQGGQAPAFDVKTANVSVGTENHVVSTPTVDVQKPAK